MIYRWVSVLPFLSLLVLWETARRAGVKPSCLCTCSGFHREDPVAVDYGGKGGGTVTEIELKPILMGNGKCACGLIAAQHRCFSFMERVPYTCGPFGPEKWPAGGRGTGKE